MDRRHDQRHRTRRARTGAGAWTSPTASCRLLGVQPVLGRVFTRQDDSPGAPKTAMISYGYWQRKFAGDRAVIGRSVKLDGEPREIVGVLPNGFHFDSTGDPSDPHSVSIRPQQARPRQLQLRGRRAAETRRDDLAGERGCRAADARGECDIPAADRHFR